MCLMLMHLADFQSIGTIITWLGPTSCKSFLKRLEQKEDLADNKMSKSEQADVKDVGGFVGGYLKKANVKPDK